MGTSWMEQIHNDEKLSANIYMIGDNPASDIIGGNMYGWNTCLVRTGVFQGGDNDENNPASFGVFPNVLEAIKTAIRKQPTTSSSSSTRASTPSPATLVAPLS